MAISSSDRKAATAGDMQMHQEPGQSSSGNTSGLLVRQRPVLALHTRTAPEFRKNRLADPPIIHQSNISSSSRTHVADSPLIAKSSTSFDSMMPGSQSPSGPTNSYISSSISLSKRGLSPGQLQDAKLNTHVQPRNPFADPSMIHQRKIPVFRNPFADVQPDVEAAAGFGRTLSDSPSPRTSIHTALSAISLAGDSPLVDPFATPRTSGNNSPVTLNATHGCHHLQARSRSVPYAASSPRPQEPHQEPHSPVAAEPALNHSSIAVAPKESKRARIGRAFIAGAASLSRMEQMSGREAYTKRITTGDMRAESNNELHQSHMESNTKSPSAGRPQKLTLDTSIGPHEPTFGLVLNPFRDTPSPSALNRPYGGSLRGPACSPIHRQVNNNGRSPASSSIARNNASSSVKPFTTPTSGGSYVSLGSMLEQYPSTEPLLPVSLTASSPKREQQRLTPPENLVSIPKSTLQAPKQGRKRQIGKALLAGFANSGQLLGYYG